MTTTKNIKKSNKPKEEIGDTTVQLQATKKMKQLKRKLENKSLKSTNAKEVAKKGTTLIQQPQDILSKNKNSNKGKKGDKLVKNVDQSTKQPQGISKKNQPKKKNAKMVNPKQKGNDEVKKGVSFKADVVDNEVEASEPPKKRNKIDDSELPTEEELAEINKPENKKNVTSIRSKKREKYEKLLLNNSLQRAVEAHQKSLNYLSLWKHNKSEWKFKKLRQIWLKDNMFNPVLVSDEMWNYVLEYFAESKGIIRKSLIEDCMKIIDVEKAEKTSDEEIQYTRARALCQNLQE